MHDPYFRVGYHAGAVTIFWPLILISFGLGGTYPGYLPRVGQKLIIP